MLGRRCRCPGLNWWLYRLITITRTSYNDGSSNTSNRVKYALRVDVDNTQAVAAALGALANVIHQQGQQQQAPPMPPPMYPGPRVSAGVEHQENLPPPQPSAPSYNTQLKEGAALLGSQCITCGEVLPASSRFCSVCGTGVA
jgi:hypothetical protein